MAALKTLSERFRHHHLLVALVLLIVVKPFMPETRVLGISVFRAFFWLTVISGVLSCANNARQLVVVFGLGGTAHLCLYQSPDDAGREGAAFPNFRASDLDVTRKELVARGVDCSEIQSMPQLRVMTIRDPDRNRIDVCEYGPSWLE